MKTSIIFLVIILYSFSGCTNKLTVDQIVNKTIIEYGGERYKNSIIKFDFRGKKYSATRNKGNFLFQRTYQDSLNVIKEYINNNGTFKEVNGEFIDLTDQQRSRIGNSINSVIYFASLPYPLQDKAVNKKLLGEDYLNDKIYYVVEVTFSEEGGGDDFDDRYIYWIEKTSFKMDFLAYYFQVNNGGSRFRVVHNERKLSGIILTDHINYKSDDLGKNEIENYLDLYGKDKLMKLSEINLENPGVELL